jgi:predicted MFS family arabinose efflux permease
VMHAAIAPLARDSQRGTAYGIFNAAYGIAWFAGSTLLGVLYDWSVPALAAVSVLLQGAALAILWRVLRSPPDRRTTPVA